MKRLIQSFAVLLSLAIAAPVASAADQQPAFQPAVVVSVASANKILKDIAYLAEAVGQPDMGNLVVFLSSGYTVGVDKAKPAGVFLTFVEGQPAPVTFIPVTDLKKLMSTHRTVIGEAKDIGGGVWELEGDASTLYIKEQDGYAYAAQQKEFLATLPPAATVLGDLPTRYSLGVHVNMQAIPADMRKMAVTQIKSAFEAQMEKQVEEFKDEEERAVQEKLSRNTLEEITQMIEEAQSYTLGWEIDSPGRQTYLDFEITAIEGTALARQMATLQDPKTRFGGFRLDDSAINLALTGNMSEHQIEKAMLMLQLARMKAFKKIEEDKDLQDPQKQTAAKGVLVSLLDVLESSIKSGELDGGAVLLLDDDQLRFAAGGRLNDGAKLDETFRNLVALAKDDPEFPPTKLNVAEYEGVAFHQMDIKIPDKEADAQKVFGERLQVTLGIKDDSFYLAFGQGGLDLVKRVIDKSIAGQAVVEPVRLKIAMGAILAFASKFDENGFAKGALEAMPEAMGRDNIFITGKPKANGSLTRLQIEEGVLKLISKGVESLQGGL
ncbi:hypothetical protein [Lignipirellula cremea]|uniref:Uncharacterized protein n=1 Tax=Lignipirellula cremea TaxID=2528010 RepID=A0A518DUJ9_9BACT|nr:hypothetical protein [Lignipirellula cremea]QDU95504.1 hypothetical protein Pla8534_33190 [Lignipirellula cremea]